MKLFHPDKTVTSCSFDGESFEKQEDGSFDVPEGAVELVHHGFTTTLPTPAAPVQAPVVHDDEETGSDILAKLAKAKKKDIAAYAFQVYNAILDPEEHTKDQLLEAIVMLAAKAADEALVKAKEEADALAELAELAALKGEE
jgi:hypothetical protein